MEIFLAFAAFILAFLAFIKRIVIFRLNTGILTMRGLFWLLVILGIIPLVSMLIHYLPDEKAAHIFLNFSSSIIELNQSITPTDNIFLTQAPYKAIGKVVLFFWNTSLFIIIIYLFYMLITPTKFSKKNAKIYFDECCHIIASGIETDIQQLTSEVSCSIPSIFYWAAQDNDSEIERYAASLIQLFSDEMFCLRIVNHNPVTLYVIFETAIKYCNTHKVIGKNLINKLILLMFTESKSLLNREEPYHGLGRFETFKKLIFGNVNFLKSEYRPLSGWFLYSKDNFSTEAIKKYSDIIEFSLGVYLDTLNDMLYSFLFYENTILELQPFNETTIRSLRVIESRLKACLTEHNDLSTIFYLALDTVGDIIEKNIYSLGQYSENEFRFSKPYQSLIACSSGVLSLIHFILQNAQKFPVGMKPQYKKYNYFDNDKNIFGSLANGIYKVIERLSTSDHAYESVRLLLMETYILSLSSTSIPLKSIRCRLSILIKDKINDNLSNLHYPAISARLIYTFGLCEPDKTKYTIHKNLLKKLKKNYLRIYKSNQEIALDMIPKDTEVDSSRKKLIRKHPVQWVRNKSLQELTLEE
jgi:hypothetical protein